MTEVILHVYDVTNSGSDKTNNTIMQINKIFKDGIGLGGIFHSAVQVLHSHSASCVNLCGFLVLVLSIVVVVWANAGAKQFYVRQPKHVRGSNPVYFDELQVFEFLDVIFPVVKYVRQVDVLTDVTRTSCVYGDEEWSFGFCEHGTGVFHCPSMQNPMYTYHESIKLGQTTNSVYKINQILRELSREWPGESYDLLAKNCNHFCDEFCERLGVSKLPVFLLIYASLNFIKDSLGVSKWHVALSNCWVNRFANVGDTAVEIAGNTAYRFRQAKTEIVTASKVAYRFLAGIASNNMITGPDSPSNSNGGTPRFQPTWFKNLVAPGEKPSSSSELEDEDQRLRQDAKAPL
ncbi:hypothetical protein SASPL_152907 [Salvia splendens]|uniref:PPPDE domain-containing protein n=1 Tax=Salvia splendens TaxID=180675 RepID=A0A8X8W482_SALSN|nr:hypothetical protein SASPL_152907 [Salvia splendens]